MVNGKFLDPTNDVAFRRIFGSERNKDILIAFLNDVLECKDNYSITDITYLNTVQIPEMKMKKESIVDVLCSDQSGSKYIIEMLLRPDEGFEKRAQFYAASAYCNQLNKGSRTGSQYSELKRVIFIVITDYTVFKNKACYKSDHVTLEKVNYTHDLQDFQFTFLELPKFRIKDIDQLTNSLEKWCYFLKYAEYTSEQDVKKLGYTALNRAYEEINQFNWTEFEMYAYNREIMCILDMRAKIEYAEEKGQLKERAKIVKWMLLTGMPIETVAKMIKISVQDVKDISNSH